MVGDFFVRTLFLDIEQRSASSKTCFDPVPIADGRFIPLPAQIYHFGTQQAREIDQTLFRSLADATVTLDLFHPIFDFRHEPSYLIILLQSVHEIRGTWIELLIADDCLAFVFQPLNIFLDPLHQYTHSGQQSISFIHRKESRKRDRGDHTYAWCVFVVTALESTRLPITTKDPYRYGVLAAEQCCRSGPSYERRLRHEPLSPASNIHL